MQNDLQKLVQTLEAQDEMKKDFIAPTQTLHFSGGNLFMTHAGHEVKFTPSTVFHSQVSEKLGIPKGYYDKMKDKAIELLDRNVNHWLTEEGKNVLIRTFQPGEGDNTARALLSDRYNMIDNMQVLMQVLETLQGIGVKVNIERSELSDTRMFIRVIAPEISMQATDLLRDYRKANVAGDLVRVGFDLQNSEIGYGSFQIAGMIQMKACLNGVIDTRSMLRRVHLGAQLDELDFHKNDAIRNANRKLINEQVKHAVNKFLSKKYLEEYVDYLTHLGDKRIEAPVSQVIEVIGRDYGFTNEMKANLLNHFIGGGDLRRIGIVNGLTEMTQLMDDIDRKNDTEIVAVDILKNFDTIEAAAIKLERSAN